MNFGFANLASLELGLPLVRVEPVLLGRQQLVLVDLPTTAFGVVGGSGFPRIRNDNLATRKREL